MTPMRMNRMIPSDGNGKDRGGGCGPEARLPIGPGLSSAVSRRLMGVAMFRNPGIRHLGVLPPLRGSRTRYGGWSHWLVALDFAMAIVKYCVVVVFFLFLLLLLFFLLFGE